MLNRLKQLRKALGLSQDQFGFKIGIGQNAVARIENGKSNLTNRNFDAICLVFNVNPEWLRTGVGEMFNAPAEKTFLDKLAEEKGLDARGKALIQSIIDLPASVREGVIDWALNLARELNAKTTEQQLQDEEQKLLEEKSAIEKRLEEISAQKKSQKFFQDGRTDEELSRAEKHLLIDEQFDAAEKRKILSVSTSTSGRAEKNSS